jgi:hypothetical protein
MASDLSSNWDLLIEGVTRVCVLARERGLRFREHYQSVNSLAYLWAWYFAALRWQDERELKELEKDSLDKSLAESLDSLMDRWLLCSQWAGVWAYGSAQNVAGFAARLAERVVLLSNKSTVSDVATALAELLESELKNIEQPAANGLMSMNAYDRQSVRLYYTPLWVWNRLDLTRWQKAQLALRQERRGQTNIEVDHIVAYELWNSKLTEYQVELEKLQAESEPAIERGEEIVELELKVNEIGNCMLLEKNFNISKSKRPLKDFLQEVHEFKNDEYTIDEWASALDLQMPQVDSGTAPVEKLAELITQRTKTIQADLEQFVRGTKARIDVRTN